MADLPALLSELGFDATTAFDGLVTVPPEMLPDTRLPFTTGLAILERAARQTHRPDLGLLLGSRHDHRSLGAVGTLMDCAPTLGRALADYVSVQRGLSHAASAYLVPMGETAALGYGIYDRYAPGTEHLHAIVAAVGVNTIRHLTGGKAELIEVHFPHRAPADMRPYERLLKARVCFNREQTAILFPRAAFGIVNPNADPQRHAVLAEALTTDLRLLEATVSQRLRHLLRPALSLGDATLVTLARRLGFSVRSLNRRLAEESTTFTQQRDAVRFVMACELLALTDLSVGEISFALSFANHSAFDRSFRRWSGATPTEWRRAQAQTSSPA